MVGFKSGAFFIVCLCNYVIGEVTILINQPQTVYDRSPKLRIKGNGFDADDHDITLEISAVGQPSLKVNKDFTITKDDQGEGIILKLLSNRKWANLDDRVPPVGLVLTKVMFASSGTTNLLGAPVIVANVLRTPSVKENLDIIYMKASNGLRINGTGFVGAKDIEFFFSPPLYKEIAYELVTPFPLNKDVVELRLRHGYEWRSEPGPLNVVGVDTGGGPVKISGEKGITVAEVQADLDLHGVTVETSAPTQYLYHDDPTLVIKGAGFSTTTPNLLRFSNGIVGKGVNFTVFDNSETSLSLRLEPGSFWRRNVENLPGVLTLLAVNAGEGYVAVGPTNAKKGRDVATIFERPSVFSSNKRLYRTQSHEFHLMGTGFPKILSKPQLRFLPPLVEGTDYTINVLDRTELEITLLDGKAWRSTPGPLLVSHINTKPGEDGWIDLPGDGVHVADIVEDIDKDITGGIVVNPSGTKVYQSALQETIEITGTGFKDKMSFTFEPELKENVDYTLSVSANYKVVLKLNPGKKWRTDAGSLIAKSITIPSGSGGSKTYPLAGVDGIRVANVLADPSILAGSESFHETQSKVISIKGKGFTNVADTKILIRPTETKAYKILNVLEDTIRVQLKPDNDWLPSYLSLQGADGADKKIPLQVSGVNTGAGDVLFDDPIVVGYIVKDREGVVCDDSCEFAFDGVCDDGTTTDYYEYYEKYGYYQDDDFGGTNYYQNYEEEPMDDYYMEDDGYSVSACVEGTDCTDCGGVDAVVDYSKPPAPDSGEEICSNTCAYARDGVCDDPRGANYCKLGTDCQDCGPAGASNFTKADDDGWWDDDDDYWNFNDGNFLEQSKGLDANRHMVRKKVRDESTGPATMFLTVLEGMVYTIGAVFAAAGLYLGMRWYQGYTLPFLHVFNPDNSIQEADEAPTRRMPITPDAFRT